MLVACGVCSFAVCRVLLELVDRIIGLRVSADQENICLDLTQHSGSAHMLVGQKLAAAIDDRAANG
jgi:ammonia channel protein AmtB